MLGGATDAGLVADPEMIVDAFEKEFRSLKAAAARV